MCIPFLTSPYPLLFPYIPQAITLSSFNNKQIVSKDCVPFVYPLIRSYVYLASIYPHLTMYPYTNHYPKPHNKGMFYKRAHRTKSIHCVSMVLTWWWGWSTFATPPTQQQLQQTTRQLNHTTMLLHSSNNNNFNINIWIHCKCSIVLSCMFGMGIKLFIVVLWLLTINHDKIPKILLAPPLTLPIE